MFVLFGVLFFFFFKQKTAYEMRISDWSSDVCSSDLACGFGRRNRASPAVTGGGVAGGKCCNAAGRPGNDTVPGGGVWIHCGEDVDHNGTGIRQAGTQGAPERRGLGPGRARTDRRKDRTSTRMNYSH